MALNLKALEEANKKLAEDRGGNGDIFKCSEIKANTEVDFRILPPPDSLAGLFYLKTVDYKLSEQEWVKSLATFGEDCPVEAMLEEAKKSEKADVAKLAKSVEQSTKFLIPAIKLDTDKSGNVTGGTPVLLQASYSLISQLNKYFISPKYTNDKEDGLADREEGLNFSIERVGSGFNDTRYTVKPFPRPTSFADEKWNSFYESVPDPVKAYQNLMGDIDEHVEKMRTFLYGNSDAATPAAGKKKKEVTDD